MADVWEAAPRLASEPFAAPYLAAVHRELADAENNGPAEGGQGNDPIRLMEAAAKHGTGTQRAAGAARLRPLGSRQPDHAEALAHLADVLTADLDRPQGEATSESAVTADDA
jgi:hypothetical protein